MVLYTEIAYHDARVQLCGTVVRVGLYPDFSDLLQPGLVSGEQPTKQVRRLAYRPKITVAAGALRQPGVAKSRHLVLVPLDSSHTILLMTKTKRKNNRDQILARLSDSGWERTCIDNDTDWWVDEHWTIRSIRQEFGLMLIVSFLVDPMYEGRDKSTAIWLITAGTQQPSDRLDDKNNVAKLYMQKGRFNEKLIAFVEEINDYRNSRRQRARDVS